MKISDRLAALRLVLGGLLLFWLQLTLQLYRQIRDLGVIFSLTSQMWLLLFGLICLSGFGFALLLLTWTHHRRRMISLTSRFIQHLPAQKPVVIGLLLVLILAFSLFVLFPLGDFFNSAAFRWLLFGLIVTVVALLLRRTLPMANWLNILALALLIVGICYRVLQFLPDISLDPFSLNWSEASRYYYASLFFSEKIYGFAVPPSTLHPTRYWLQSLPFLLSTLPLWFHRAWQVFLWLACSLGAAWLLARRLKIASQTWLLLFLAWTFLFLWQGPVYYHLLVMVMLVLWGFDPRRFWRSLLIVALASA
ncbi:MAG TPA: hypothetical protein DEH22_16045, partial [Chloroflexi bacterium]|nr:hypothetical protein [Chloroflexota bacterium]